MIFWLKLQSLLHELGAQKYSPLFFDPLRWIRSACVAAAWSCYVMLYAVGQAFEGVLPEEWWLASAGAPLLLADRAALGAPMLDSAGAHPGFVLYFYAPVILFALSFVCVLLFAFAMAVIRQVFEEIRLILRVLSLVAQETVNFALL